MTDVTGLHISVPSLHHDGNWEFAAVAIRGGVRLRTGTSDCWRSSIRTTGSVVMAVVVVEVVVVD